ncbi:hypothetical protein TNCV_1181321 [Trichonephila clavipes]|nr:hypothetical protein TNCV_1181321 [Trichonephila clavipes]
MILLGLNRERDETPIGAEARTQLSHVLRHPWRHTFELENSSRYTGTLLDIYSRVWQPDPLSGLTVSITSE